jgi:hypothetical protein
MSYQKSLEGRFYIKETLLFTSVECPECKSRFNFRVKVNVTIEKDAGKTLNVVCKNRHKIKGKLLSDGKLAIDYGNLIFNYQPYEEVEENDGSLFW